MRWGIILVLLLCLPLASAATLQGTIYDENLEVTRAMVTLTSPEQRMLAEEGSYSFDVSPGNYTLFVASVDGSVTATEYILIPEEGAYTYDLFLFGDLELDLDSGLEIVAEPLIQEEDLTPPTDVSGVLERLLIILLLGLFGYFAWKRIQVRAVDEQPDADDLVERVLAIIASEGRISQKDLRARFSESEAKISLVVSELEADGKIKKIKKGRGNILVLVK